MPIISAFPAKNVVYTPSISQDGILSWENNGGLDNPDPVNIKGPKGDAGTDGVIGPAGKSAYQYALDGGYTGTEAEFQALLGTGPWVPGTRAELTGKLNAKASQSYTVVPKTGAWYKVGQITVGETFSAYIMLTDIRFDNPNRPTLGWLVLGGNLTRSGEKYIYGKLIYLYGRGTGNQYIRIVVTEDGGLYAKGGTYATGKYNAARLFRVSLLDTPVEVSDLPENIIWDSWEHTDGVTLRSEPASNKNLLDNWYFPDPINQRGIASDTLLRNGYFLDRWTNRQANKVKWVSGEGIYLYYPDSGYQAIDQIFKSDFLPANTPITISVLYGENKLLTASGTWGSRLASVSDGSFNIGLTPDYPSAGKSSFRIVLYPPDGPVLVKAVKMEVGTEQTLARKDANGNWVLNDPPPNKELELLKCQKYQLFGPILGTYYQMTGGAPRVLLPTPIPMRATPTVVGTPEVYGVNPNNLITGVSFTAPSVRNNGVLLTLTGATVPAWVSFNSGSGLDANL